MTTLGEQLQIDGVAANVAAADAINRTYKDHAEAILDDLCAQGVEFTADDIHEAIPQGVTPHSDNLVPSLINQRSRAKAITHVGWCRSTRPSRHGSVNRVWRATGCGG